MGDLQDPTLIRRARLAVGGGGHGHRVNAENRHQPPFGLGSSSSSGFEGSKGGALDAPLTETEAAPQATSSVSLAARHPANYGLQSGAPARLGGADLGRAAARWPSHGVHAHDLDKVRDCARFRAFLKHSFFTCTPLDVRLHVLRPIHQVGPGAYVVRSTLGQLGGSLGVVRRSAQGVMQSHSQRPRLGGGAGPGPGAYDPVRPHGNLLRETFNAAIAAQAGPL